MSSTACTCVGRFRLLDARIVWVVIVVDPQCNVHTDEVWAEA